MCPRNAQHQPDQIVQVTPSPPHNDQSGLLQPLLTQLLLAQHTERGVLTQTVGFAHDAHVVPVKVDTAEEVPADAEDRFLANCLR